MVMVQLSWSNRCLLTCTVMFLASIGHVWALKCYICHTDDNELCSNELRDCPTDQAYDRCMTTIIKKPIDGLHIKKQCALGPCTIEALSNLNFGNFRSSCESSSDNGCIYCCAEDGCNKDAALSRTSALSIPLLCLMSIICLVLHRIQLLL